MAKTYRVTPTIRFFNRLMTFMVRRGIAPRTMHVLTVRGRRSGNNYSTPVSLLMRERQRFLVSPYGEVSWVKNARAAGEVTITRGGRHERLNLRELRPAEAAPYLKAYVSTEDIVRPYFDAAPDAPLDAFEAEAASHPVFELLPIPAGA
jgi:deazaflavin-dependent oxidoreductase (nitroreductase family)